MPGLPRRSAGAEKRECCPPLPVQRRRRFWVQRSGAGRVEYDLLGAAARGQLRRRRSESGPRGVRAGEPGARPEPSRDGRRGVLVAGQLAGVTMSLRSRCSWPCASTIAASRPVPGGLRRVGRHDDFVTTLVRDHGPTRHGQIQRATTSAACGVGLLGHALGRRTVHESDSSTSSDQRCSSATRRGCSSASRSRVSQLLSTHSSTPRDHQSATRDVSWPRASRRSPKLAASWQLRL